MKPLFRALMLKATMSGVTKLSAAAGAGYRGLLPADLLQRAETAGVLSWVDAQDQVVAISTARLALSPGEFETLWRSVGPNIFEFPLLSSALQLSLKFSGNSPFTVLKTIPIALTLVGQNMGTLTAVSTDPNRAQLKWVDCPFAQERDFVDAVKFAFSGLAEVGRHKAITNVAVAGRDLTFDVSWKLATLARVS
jgi:hypothetical protein